jgi:hypothetical protein
VKVFPAPIVTVPLIQVTAIAEVATAPIVITTKDIKSSFFIYPPFYAAVQM